MFQSPPTSSLTVFDVMVFLLLFHVLSFLACQVLVVGFNPAISPSHSGTPWRNLDSGDHVLVASGELQVSIKNKNVLLVEIETPFFFPVYHTIYHQLPMEMGHLISFSTLQSMSV